MTGRANEEGINQEIARAGSDSQHSFFVPRPDASNHAASARNYNAIDAPEKKLTIFAFRLAILEKVASGLGTLAFIWATVVLLGGFAITLERKDFVFVTAILLTEGTRIFSRSHELEWQHQARWTMQGARRSSFRALHCGPQFILRLLQAALRPLSVFQRGGEYVGNLGRTPERSRDQGVGQATRRTWPSHEVQILPYTGWLSLSKNVSRVLIVLQILSAMSAVALCLMRLIEHDYGVVAEESKSRKLALDLFYVLALAAALMFLLEKAYWTWRISYNRLLYMVARDSGLQPSEELSIRRFFYEAYSKSIQGSVFESLEMDLVTFAKDLLLSESHEEQLMGGKILHSFIQNKHFTSDTLRKLGESTPVMERLIEMLNWKSPQEENIRSYAAEIVSKLAGNGRSAHRIAGIPGAMDSISSLLYTGRSSSPNSPPPPPPPDAQSSSTISDESNYNFAVFNILGLEILEMLAHDNDNCSKIGMGRDLLPKILYFTNDCHILLLDDKVKQSDIQPVKKSLKVVKLLVRTTGSTGKKLRREICEIVFAVSNIRQIMKYGEAHMDLQKLGIEILACLAMDESGKEIIGRTGGIIKLLLNIFLEENDIEEGSSLKGEAGEAIAMITLESEDNCYQILKEPEVLRRLRVALTSPTLKLYAARILRNLFAYCKADCSQHLVEISASITEMLQDIMEAQGKLLEALIGLSTQICKLMNHDDFAKALKSTCITEIVLVRKMVDILKTYKNPDEKVPRIRRFVIDQVIWLIKSSSGYIQLFRSEGMKECIDHVAETTTELDNFHVFSGGAGLVRHRNTMSSLVETALNLLTEDDETQLRRGKQNIDQ